MSRTLMRFVIGYVSHAPSSACNAIFEHLCWLPSLQIEVREQLEEAGLGQFIVKEIGDRYLEVSGRW